MRLDLYLAEKFSISRSKAQKLIKNNLILVNKTSITRSSHLVSYNDEVVILENVQNKNIDSTLFATIVIKDIQPDFLIIEKPSGISSHPAHESDNQTCISNWVTFRSDVCTFETDDIRNGIVHRLDKDTSGLMIIARNEKAQEEFKKLFEEREIKKTYHAITQGIPDPLSGTLSWNIMRDPLNPTMMTYSRGQGKHATTFYKTLSYNKEYAYVECNIITGRTHQIRVHFKALKTPLLGDHVYGTTNKIISRHALHAHMISFVWKEKEYSYTSSLPEDIKKIVETLL